MEPIPLPAPGVYENVPEHDYRRWDAVNQSTLWTFRRTPAHARYAFLHPSSTPTTDLGSAIHAVLLEPHRLEDRYAVRPPGIDRRTRDGKAEWAQFVADSAGKIVLEDRAVYDTLLGVRDQVLGHPRALDLLTRPGFTEVSMRWEDPDLGVACKGRADRIVEDDGYEVLLDVKSTRDASPLAFARSVDNFGYHVQAAFYLDGADAAIEPCDRRFYVMAVEKEPPYAIALYELDSVWLDYGRSLYRSFLRDWKRCTESGVWPGFPEHVETLEAPDWIAKRLEVIA